MFVNLSRVILYIFSCNLLFPLYIMLYICEVYLGWYGWFSCKVVSDFCDLVDCGLPGFSGISQKRILEWVATSFSRGSSRPRDWTLISFIGIQILYYWASREAPGLVCTLLINSFYTLKFSWSIWLEIYQFHWFFSSFDFIDFLYCFLFRSLLLPFFFLFSVYLFIFLSEVIGLKSFFFSLI